ncbi:parallel beta-helix repeat (two copies) [Methanococcoides vulcani]|uniref:Parallel beta-helix repeat (Two copies) n=1 Tax=Methanococcoides vulcani TaxID=1353158 RepID=A0A1H9ZQ25_9EURY|nr:parallel beta-helix repeat (two copies) [Methanococcoides vulcani]
MYNSYAGIELYGSSDYNNLTSNTASNNNFGIIVEYSSNNNLTSNTASNNNLNGIDLYFSSNNNLTSNTASNNTDHGIYLDWSGNNDLTSNTASNNTDHGIYLEGPSNNNIIYNNYFNNTHNAYDAGTNKWNITKTAGTNIIGGDYLGGNYWSNYTGVDTDGDGLGNTLLPYNSSGGITSGGDYLPLTTMAIPTVHNIDSSKGFFTIQAAIDDSGTFDGHTIVVDKGIYTENVDVNKELTIISESGNPDDTHVQANNSSVHVFNVTRNNVTISGFNVTGATNTSGIFLDGILNNTISNNNLSNNDYGIHLNSSSNNTLTNNTASNNTGHGIRLTSSSYNNLTDNTASNNTWSGINLGASRFTGPSNNNILTDNTASNNNIGIMLSVSSYNKLISNTATDNTDHGIYLVGKVRGPGSGPSNYNILTDNTALNNSYGIWLYYSSYNNLTSNTATDNTGDGIYLEYSSNNNLTNNTAMDNIQYGIHLVGEISPSPGSGPSSYNILTDNTASSNDYGIRLNSSNYNNLTSNTATDNTGDGISLRSSSYNILTDNTATDNTGDGINLNAYRFIVIGVIKSNNNILTDNTASNNNYGIRLTSSSNNTLTSNTASNNTWSGITLGASRRTGHSNNNILTDNTALNNTDHGIYLSVSSNNTLTNNTATDNTQHGIYLDGRPKGSITGRSSYNILTDNMVSNNGNGIWLYYSSYNNLTSNTATDNTGDGIYLEYSSNNKLTNNTAMDNTQYGIHLVGEISPSPVSGPSSYNILTDNTAMDNNIGIRLYNSTSNTIYNNHFNNTNNTEFAGTNTGNIWNITKTAGLNIIGGPYLGGNYWAYPNGTGFSQVNADANGDGFCDSPENEYVFDGNTDYLPLTDPNWAPVADANGPYVGDEGSSITFDGSNSTDPDGDTLTYRWDFNNDGIWDTGWSDIPTANNTWNDDWSGVVKLEVNDSKIATNDTAIVTVNNVAPNITLTVQPTEPIEVGTEVILNATFTDPGSLDTHNYTIDWGDGTESATLTLGVRAVDANHTYAAAGLYNVTLTVEDDELDSDTKFKYVIVYDSDGGSVAGKGSFDSLAGAYMDESLKGVATFDFNSEYKKSKLRGETQFEFESLKFQSESYYWMVVEGHKATCRGNGMVNGEDDYEFLVSVIDDDDDLFRIKIWNATTVIYDNNIGIDGDYADPITEVEKGRIQIKT